AEVIDLRCLIPLDARAILDSVSRTGRLFTVEENPRVLGWGAEIVSIVADDGFDSLDAPLVRITAPNIPLPSAAVLEDLAVPSVERITATVRRRLDESR
ncbi:MAG TPA: transketolase C-terminal domain-containing protein, partial [Acidimicrobiales bacterium]|nr:transketolase C-terminal domain-containing protein [Acidimicrobiales bacterium]